MRPGVRKWNPYLCCLKYYFYPTKPASYSFNGCKTTQDPPQHNSVQTQREGKPCLTAALIWPLNFPCCSEGSNISSPSGVQLGLRLPPEPPPPPSVRRDAAGFKTNVIICHRKPIRLLSPPACAPVQLHMFRASYLRMWFPFSVSPARGLGKRTPHALIFASLRFGE